MQHGSLVQVLETLEHISDERDGYSLRDGGFPEAILEIEGLVPLQHHKELPSLVVLDAVQNRHEVRAADGCALAEFFMVGG